MAIELSDVNGIGPATVSLLQQHGFKSASDIANAEIEQLTAVPGFSYLRATAVIENAQSLFVDDDQGTTTDNPKAVTETQQDKKVKKAKKEKKSDVKKKSSKSKKDSKSKKSDKDKKTKKAKKK